MVIDLVDVPKEKFVEAYEGKSGYKDHLLFGSSYYNHACAEGKAVSAANQYEAAFPSECKVILAEHYD